MKYTVQNTSDIGRHIIVFLNGVEQKDCVECDTEQGYVIKVKKDEKGGFVIENDEIALELLEGVVTVMDVI